MQIFGYELKPHVTALFALLALSVAPLPAAAYLSIGYHGNGLHIGTSLYGHHGYRGSRHGYRSFRGHRRSHYRHSYPSTYFSLHSYPRSYYGNNTYFGFSTGYNPSYYGRSYYPGYRSAYSYPSYSTYPVHSNTRDYASTAYDPSYQPQAYVSPGDAKRFSGQGWDLLAKGRPTEALSKFSVAEQSDANNGLAKLGYALATAASGDYERGVYAMRRAFREASGALTNIQLHADLKPTVHGLLYAYQENPDNREHAFMAAALAYLLHETSAATQAINDARKTGDRSASARNLQNMIADLTDDRHAVAPQQNSDVDDSARFDELLRR